MINQKASKANIEKIIKFLSSTSKDPVRFVEEAFFWGHKELKQFHAPLKWQYDILNQIKSGLISPTNAIKIAVASGHGIGKSALVSWIILWSLSTKPNTKGVVTANTENQLKTKTWAELSKWFRLSIISPLFKFTSTSIYSIDTAYEKSWRIDMVAWSENNSEAFAGLHNQDSRILLIFDEASAIPDSIWEVSEGALTDQNTEILWLAFGNPTRADGRFKDCFSRYKHRWIHRQISSLDVEITNKIQIQEWIDDYGITSDFIKVRVLGEFPTLSQNQLIPYDFINISRQRDIKIADCLDDVKIIGVDVARFGDDSSCIVLRHGKIIVKILRYHKIDTMHLADIVATQIDTFQPDAVFIDQTGVGGGVIDRLHQMGRDVLGIDFGSRADNPSRYFNKRAEIWHKMSKWIKESGKILDDKELIADLVAPTFSYSGDSSQIMLEKKEVMKKRGLSSPDSADALALTFAKDVLKKDLLYFNFNKNDAENDLTKLQL